ncbi:hypothetical protein KP509_33G008800 [Ceratopteris richardii]|nr:hypothetical protein KP509_33G008800 [Ceratopteris richardii]
MSEDSILPDSATLTIVLKGFCKQGRVDEALLFFEKMGPKVDGHEASYNILVHGLCFKMRIEEALNMASEMCRRGIVLTVHTYTAFVCAYFKMGKVEAACDILLELKKSGINADNTLCVELIIGLCQNNRVDSALALLKQMPECGCTPNQIHYTAVISGLCKANRVPEAMVLGHTMIKSRNRPDSITFSPIFEALCTSGKEKEAYELLDGLVENGADLTTGIFSSLIRGLCKARRLDGVRKLMAEMTTRGYHPDAVVYATLINANAHYLPGTVDLFTPLIGSNIVLSAARYADLMGGLFRSGEVEFALKVFKEMQRVGCPTRTESFNVIIDGLCRNNRVQEALEYLQNMKEHGCMPDHITYTILIHYFGMIGEFGRMDSLYKEMRANGCKPDDVTYSVLLQGFSKCERFNELYAVLDDMKTEGFPPNDPALRLLFENLRHKDQKRMTKYLKKEFGVSYELLTSVEADSSVKTKGKSDTKLIKGEDLCKSGKEVKSHRVPNSNKKIDSDNAKGTSTDSEGQCNKVFDSKHSSLTKNLGKSTRKSSKRSEKNMTDSFEKSNELNESVRFQEEKDIFKRSEAFSGRHLNNSGKEYPSAVDSKKSSAVKDSVKPVHRSSNKSKKEKAGSREKSDKLMESVEVPEQSNRKRVSYFRKKDSSKAAKEENCSKVFQS